MKTKTKIIITILASIILSLSILIVTITGIKRTEKMPIKESKVNEQAIQESKYEELENIPLDYDFANMIEDECYVVMNGNAVYNIEQLDNFIKNVRSNVPDEIRIVQYTIEGEPIISNLKYTRDKFILKNDSRRDHWSAEKDRVITTEEYNASIFDLVLGETANDVTNKRKDYEVYLISKETGEKRYICSYVQIRKESGNFKLIFTKDDSKVKTLILGKDECNKVGYDFYSYKGNIEIIINNKKMSLRDALLNNQIKIDDILSKAEKDLQAGIIYGDVYRDGGSKMYIYDDYSIIKFHTLDGNNDLYIGSPNMNINDL